MLTEAQISRVMGKLGYHPIYDNGRRKIWSRNSPSRPGAATHVEIRYPIRRSDLEHILIDKSVLADPGELDGLLG